MSRRICRTSLLALPALLLAALPLTGHSADAAQPSEAAPRATAARPGNALWTPTSKKLKASHQGHRRAVHPSSYKAFTLAKASMAKRLSKAPNERSMAARRGRTVMLAVPAPTGELIRFAVVESSIMQRKLQRKYPQIRTYAGSSVTKGYAASIRLDQTPQGFHASVRDGHASWYVDPAYLGDDSLYLSYFGAALPSDERGLVEPELDKNTVAKLTRDASPRVGEGPNGLVIQRVYRLALITDRSYAQYVAPGLNDGTQEAASDTAVLAAKTTLMNRVNQIYNDDLAIKMVFVSNINLLNLNRTAEETAAGYPASGSGSIGAGCTSAILNETQSNIDAIIGAANYDIGHIALGINGGGIAGLGVVGQNGNEGRGCTGVPTPVGDLMAIDYVAHEMGHQFSGNHTFNGTQGNCSGGNRNQGTSVEPGSGSSVMAYAGICAKDDLQPHTDPYFSQRSQQEATAYITGAGGATDTRDGFQQVTTTNHNPTVTAPANKSIPLRTPFTLTGSATDSDGNPLVYLWEQNNNAPLLSSGTALTSTSKTGGPLFRVFGKYASVTGPNSILYNSPGENLATSDPSRTFPDMAQVLAGSTNAAAGTCPTNASTPMPDGPALECLSEFLPTSSYVGSLTFRLTARDQIANGGGTHFAETTLTPVAGTGPFLVSSQSTNVSYAGGSTQTVTWAVAGTNTVALAQNVKISLSTDGGLTFPNVLLASTGNDGTETVTIPNIGTTTARIKIEAVGNYFFDVNDSPFTIVQTLVNTVAPTISGTPTPGQVLTAGNGTWSPAATGHTYQWFANAVPIAGATSQTFTPTAAQEGKLVAVNVTASRAGFTSATKSSPSVRVVTTPIQNTTPPLITGTPSVGSTLTLSNGSWNYGDLTFTYQWYADGAAIRGATASTYLISATMSGKTITGRVTASRPGSDAVTATSSNSVVPS